MPVLLPSAIQCAPQSPLRPSTPSRRENIIQTCRSLQSILSLSPRASNILPRTPTKPRFPVQQTSRASTPRTPPAVNLNLKRVAKTPKTPRTPSGLRPPVRLPERGKNKRRRETDDVGEKEVNSNPMFVFGGVARDVTPERDSATESRLEENPFVTPKRVRIERETVMPMRVVRPRRRRAPVVFAPRRVQEEWEWDNGELADLLPMLKLGEEIQR